MLMERTVLFRNFMDESKDEIKARMTWENYDVTKVEIPVTELVKEHTWRALRDSYGKFRVEMEDGEYIDKDMFLNEVFLSFPILLQELSITRLIDSESVNTHDLDVEDVTRTETTDGSVNTDNSNVNTELVSEQSVVDGEVRNSGTVIDDSTGSADRTNEIKNTGTVKDESNLTYQSDGTTNIQNDSNVDLNTSHQVGFQRAMPEQSIDGQTQNFPMGADNIPNLNASMVQSATESFNATSPIASGETSVQTVDSTNTTTGDTTRTDNLTQLETSADSTVGKNTRTDNLKNEEDTTTTRTGNNTTTDTGNTKVTEDRTVTYSEHRELKATNKQYSYEVNAFLTSAGSVVAFRNFLNRFDWVVGII